MHERGIVTRQDLLVSRRVVSRHLKVVPRAEVAQ
jgi:hypothetical protein